MECVQPWQQWLSTIGSSQLLPQWQTGSVSLAEKRAKHLLLVQAAPQSLFAPGSTKATSVKGFLRLLGAGSVLFVRYLGPQSLSTEILCLHSAAGIVQNCV